MKEKDVKFALRKYLHLIGAYQYWPVPMGYGATTLDVLVCHRGKFIGIEVKRPGIKSATPRQSAVMREIVKSGGEIILENTVELENVKRVLFS